MLRKQANRGNGSCANEGEEAVSWRDCCLEDYLKGSFS